MNTASIKAAILENAMEISRLHVAVHERCKHRDEDPEAYREWTQAAEELRTRYDDLAFPGGYPGALQRIIDGDPFAMEAAICFLELRPFFFRSGYMFKDVLRTCRKAPLSTEQRLRLQRIETNVSDWRRRKTSSGTACATTNQSRTS